ncbi:pilus assembly protein TadG-related protein [Jannaschia seohaensis]|uniref:Flp pilus-assembly TadE/G-like n=1 Tax=Jannaschia seohaensis TaxID=475081 RepID=A0A2Y9AJX4_9RHOB|nr:Tad domain-containing protein [Jannaschia seohaensis]PWJ20306.1 putative Flp pilus-assembly TadE/G-like protein [Jannaschia seohaensis]SSA44336.1 Putative Flp pilus-assembly TadE/G-like [Jannaschia seohaensis]
MTRRPFPRLTRDARGSILPMVGVLLGLFCGLMALTFDTGRLGVTHSELQGYADHVALAAAGELDLRPDSIDRATAAAAAMVSDYSTYGDGGRDFETGDYTLTFYSTLPASDTDAVTATTTDPTRARYVGVQLDVFDAGFSFGRAFTQLTGQADLNTFTSAGAVAGMTQYACDITPLMFCIPAADPVTGALWRADDNIGQMIHLRDTGNEAWGPGNFGFLASDDIIFDDEGPCAEENSVAGEMRCMVGAREGVTQCFAQNGVNSEPGQNVGIFDYAFNTRFDMYQGAMSQKRNDPAYAPAPNVVKGVISGTGNQCIGNNTDPSNAAKLPWDNCLITGSCDFDLDGLADPYGDGTWNDAAYVAQNHGLVDPRDTYGFDPLDPKEGKYIGTRWEMYVAETKMNEAHALAVAQAQQNGTTAPLTGSPLIDGLLQETVQGQCSANVAPEPERRVIYVAAVNCDPDAGGTEIVGRTNDVPVHDYVKIFLTEPVSSSATTPRVLSIYGEVLGSAGGSGGGTGSVGGTYRDVVQLYR